MSFSIMEAMSCGIPTISSNILSNKFLINDTKGYCVNLYNFHNSSKFIAAKIIKEFKNKKRYYKKMKLKLFIDKNLLNYICYKNF